LFLVSLILIYQNFFTLRVGDTWCRHRYRLYFPCCKSTDGYNFVSYRVTRVWNAFPKGKGNFQSLDCL